MDRAPARRDLGCPAQSSAGCGRSDRTRYALTRPGLAPGGVCAGVAGLFDGDRGDRGSPVCSSGPERGVGPQHQRARVVGAAGPLDVILDRRPAPADHRGAGQSQAQLGVLVAGECIESGAIQGDGVTGPSDQGEHGDVPAAASRGATST